MDEAALFSRVYGQRHSLKVYPFGARLGPFKNGTGASMCGPNRNPTDMMQAECWWPTGSTEQCVWEGVGTSVHLPTGAYTISLIGETDTGATVQPELLAFADR